MQTTHSIGRSITDNQHESGAQQGNNVSPLKSTTIHCCATWRANSSIKQNEQFSNLTMLSKMTKRIMLCILQGN